MAVDIQISGIEEVSKLLLKLPDNMREKYVKRAMKEAASFIVTSLRSRVPKDTGTLRDSIQASRIKYYPAEGTLFCAIEPKGGFTRTFPRTIIKNKTRRVSKRSSRGWSEGPLKKNPRKYLHLVEGGRDPILTHGQTLHPALSGRFFTRAKGVAGHPVFGPVAASMARPFQIAVENELNKAVAEFNNTTT